MSSGPGPSCSLGSSNFHPWLFVLMFYPIHERWVSKDIREDGVQTSCPEQIWGGGELRHREGKGQVGGRTGLDPVVFPSPCWLTPLSPRSLCPQMSVWGRDGALRLTQARLGFVEGSVCQPSKGVLSLG